MNWLSRYRRLRDLGVLGMNERNTRCILDHNPRTLYPRVDSKAKMRDLCAAIGVPTPELYATVATHSALARLPRLLEGHPDFVIKPNRGAGGRGILVVTGRDGAAFVRHNGARLPFAEVRQHVSDIVSGLYSLGGQSDQALIQQRVVPDSAFSRISYQGTADIRVVLYQHVPVMAMVRLPTKLSVGRANLHQGAVGAGLDLETGIACHAVLRNRITEHHPDTGEQIVGFQVPYWPDIRGMACRVSKAVELGYLGADIVIDKDRGPLLLEANARPGLAIQIANGVGLLHRLEEVDRALAGAPPLARPTVSHALSDLT